MRTLAAPRVERARHALDQLTEPQRIALAIEIVNGVAETGSRSRAAPKYPLTVMDSTSVPGSRMQGGRALKWGV